MNFTKRPKEVYVVKRLAEYYRASGFLAKPLVNLGMEAIRADRELPWPAQPDIDLLLSPLKGYIPTLTHIAGHELKLFGIKQDGTLDQSYYVGLDEALALLAFGVDYAVLEAVIWNCNETKTYCWYFKPLIHLANRLPIGFLLRGAHRSPSGIVFTDPSVEVKPKHNPMLTLESVQKARQILNQTFTVQL